VKPITQKEVSDGLKVMRLVSKAQTGLFYDKSLSDFPEALNYNRASVEVSKVLLLDENSDVIKTLAAKLKNIPAKQVADVETVTEHHIRPTVLKIAKKHSLNQIEAQALLGNVLDRGWTAVFMARKAARQMMKKSAGRKSKAA